MIKALGTGGDGNPVAILGDLGLPPCQVVIVGGRTEDSIAKQMAVNGLISHEVAEAATANVHSPAASA